MNAFHSKIELEIDLTPSERELVLSVFPKGAMIGAAISSGIGSAVYIAIVSALYKKNLKVGLAVLGNISVGGAIERVINFADKVTMLSENGAKSVIVPMDNLPELSNVPPTVLGNTDVPFYQNNQMLMQKAILLDWI